MTPVTAGVIVAAGTATRMGELKQLIALGERPMLQWVVDAAEASRLDRVVVVTGPGDAEVRSKIRLERASFVRNMQPERGTMSSLRAGVAGAGPADAVMKLVADQPEVTTGDIDALIGAWDPDRFSSALISYSDGPGHPLLVGRDLLDRVLRRDGDRLLWHLIEGNAGGLLLVSVDRPRPVDVNDPADLELVRSRLFRNGDA